MIYLYNLVSIYDKILTPNNRPTSLPSWRFCFLFADRFGRQVSSGFWPLPSWHSESVPDPQEHQLRLQCDDLAWPAETLFVREFQTFREMGLFEHGINCSIQYTQEMHYWRKLRLTIKFKGSYFQTNTHVQISATTDSKARCSDWSYWTIESFLWKYVSSWLVHCRRCSKK